MASYVNGRLGGFPYQCVREGNEVKLRVWIDGLICAADINYAMTANGVGKTGITPLMLVAMRGHAGPGARTRCVQRPAPRVELGHDVQGCRHGWQHHQGGV